MAEMQIQCPECSGLLQIQSEWCGKYAKCPLCQEAIFIPEAQEPIELQQGPIELIAVDTKMMINDSIEATPEKIYEMIEDVTEGKEEFVKLSCNSEFLKTTFDKYTNLFYLEFCSGKEYSTIRKTQATNINDVKTAFFKFYQRDYSFKFDFTWKHGTTIANTEPLGCGAAMTAVFLIAIFHFILVWLFGSWPRTLFWFFALFPALYGLSLINDKKFIAKFTGILIFIYLVAFGYWSHTKGLEKVVNAKNQQANCKVAIMSQVQKILEKNSGNKNIFITKEWELTQTNNINKNCTYTVNSKYFGTELNNIPLDAIILSCEEHSKNKIRASAFLTLYTLKTKSKHEVKE